MPSSVIAQMEYNRKTRVLRIVFVSGKTYDYLEVPETVFWQIRSAPSKGVFFNQEIKPYYAFRKIKKKELHSAHKIKK